MTRRSNKGIVITVQINDAFNNISYGTGIATTFHVSYPTKIFLDKYSFIEEIEGEARRIFKERMR